MIDFQNVWLPQILGYANLMAAPETLRLSWTEGDRSRTSVTDLGELIEQIFGDLDSNAMLEHARGHVADQQLLTLLGGFIQALLAVDQKHPDNSSPDVVLESAEWKCSTKAANDLISYANARGYVAL